jgi:anti-sigma28 factor (negative regulator of flagellin synthesis)
MISQVNGAAIRSAYQNGETQVKNERKSNQIEVSKQGDASKVDAIKEAIEKGEYRVNLEALSQKIADELL